MSKYMGQIMAECDCQHQACEMRGYCMSDRIEELEAENERLLDEAVEAVMSAAENMVYTATKRNGDRKLRFDAFEVEAELKGAAEYYASAIRALKKGGDA